MVVADTSPLNYLILIREIAVLEELYGRVIVPSAVADELGHASSPPLVGEWIARPPAWLEVQVLALPVRQELDRLDRGEQEAIELAVRLGSALVLIDEERGRKKAIQLSLRVRGTLGILIQAARLQLVDLTVAHNDLERTTFHLTPALRELTLRLGHNSEAQ